MEQTGTEGFTLSVNSVCQHLIAQLGRVTEMTMELARILYQIVQLPGGFMQISLLASHSVACFIGPRSELPLPC